MTILPNDELALFIELRNQRQTSQMFLRNIATTRGIFIFQSLRAKLAEVYEGTERQSRELYHRRKWSLRLSCSDTFATLLWCVYHFAGIHCVHAIEQISLRKQYRDVCGLGNHKSHFVSKERTWGEMFMTFSHSCYVIVCVHLVEQISTLIVSCIDVYPQFHGVWFSLFCCGLYIQMYYWLLNT